MTDLFETDNDKLAGFTRIGDETDPGRKDTMTGTKTKRTRPERLGEHFGAPEFDTVHDKLVELLRFAIAEKYPPDGPWEPMWDTPALGFRGSADVDRPERLDNKQRYFYNLLMAFEEGQSKLGISWFGEDGLIQLKEVELPNPVDFDSSYSASDPPF